MTKNYEYHVFPLKPKEAKESYKTYPSKISHNEKSAISLAALVAEYAIVLQKQHGLYIWLL